MWALLFLVLQHAGEVNVETGKEYYRLRCSQCHGAAGEGGRGPNLSDGIYFHGSTDDELYDTIRNGIRGTEMPGFGSSEQRLRDVVAFIRTLNQAAKPSEVTGDPDRGAELFRGKGDCLSCHRVGPEGSYSGPALTSVGSRRSLEHLRTSILDPSDDVRRDYWVTTVTGPDSEAAVGFVLNEDTHSLQLLDVRGRLRSFDKEKLASIERDENSMMQSYDGVFDEGELDDLLAYLASLRPGRTP